MEQFLRLLTRKNLLICISTHKKKTVDSLINIAGNMEIVEELCFCNLRQFIKDRDMTKAWKVAYVINHICDGLEYMHSRNFIHRYGRTRAMQIKILHEKVS